MVRSLLLEDQVQLALLTFVKSTIQRAGSSCRQGACILAERAQLQLAYRTIEYLWLAASARMVRVFRVPSFMTETENSVSQQPWQLPALFTPLRCFPTNAY